jgi:hypothetical protein
VTRPECLYYSKHKQQFCIFCQHKILQVFANNISDLNNLISRPTTLLLKVEGKNNTQFHYTNSIKKARHTVPLHQKHKKARHGSIIQQESRTSEYCSREMYQTNFKCTEFHSFRLLYSWKSLNRSFRALDITRFFNAVKSASQKQLC